MSKSYPSAYKKIEKNPYVSHIRSKASAECIFLAIPFLNILLAYQRNKRVRPDSFQVRGSESDDLVTSSEEIRKAWKKEREEVDSDDELSQSAEVDEQVEDGNKIELLAEKSRLIDSLSDKLTKIPKDGIYESREKSIKEIIAVFNKDFDELSEKGDVKEIKEYFREVEKNIDSIRNKWLVEKRDEEQDEYDLDDFSSSSSDEDLDELSDDWQGETIGEGQEEVDEQIAESTSQFEIVRQECNKKSDKNMEFTGRLTKLFSGFMNGISIEKYTNQLDEKYGNIMDETYQAYGQLMARDAYEDIEELITKTEQDLNSLKTEFQLD